MNLPDYVILAVIAISTGVGVLRGFISEVFSLLVWAVAFLVAYHFGGDVAALMEPSVTVPSARIAMGFAGVFIVVLLVGGLINYLLGRLVKSTGRPFYLLTPGGEVRVLTPGKLRHGRGLGRRSLLDRSAQGYAGTLVRQGGRA